MMVLRENGESLWAMAIEYSKRKTSSRECYSRVDDYRPVTSMMSPNKGWLQNVSYLRERVDFDAKFLSSAGIIAIDSTGSSPADKLLIL